MMFSMEQKWKMGPEEMRALNETVDQRELDSMGISDGAEFRRQSSSFAFDHVTADFGPGASAAREELRNLVAEVRCLCWEGRGAILFH